ncbi:MAG: lytic transglycosylase domain-containing protein [Myxococcota bacterium]
MRSRSAGRCLLLVAALLLGFPPGLASAQIFTYTDENGVVHFTNRPRDGRYRPLERDHSLPQKGRRAPQQWQYDGLIGSTAARLDVQPALVKAVIAAESNFDPGAVSHKGAQGLMQLMPATAAAMGVEDPMYPPDNVMGGTRYLRHMIDRYGDLERALAAYNAGPEAVDRYGGIPPYAETQAYVRRVLTYYRTYDGDFRQ